MLKVQSILCPKRPRPALPRTISKKPFKAEESEERNEKERHDRDVEIISDFPPLVGDS